MVKHLDIVAGIDWLSDNGINQYLPFYYQAMTEIGFMATMWIRSGILSLPAKTSLLHLPALKERNVFTIPFPWNGLTILSVMMPTG